MKVLLIISTVLAGLTAIAAAPAMAQSNLGWMRDAPAASFTKADTQLLVNALHSALDGKADGAAMTWENPAAGNSGSITPAPDPKGRAGCRLAHILNRHKTVVYATDVVFCKTGGEWKYTPS
jgi:surface antigen